jgi:hypothetical protein
MSEKLDWEREQNRNEEIKQLFIKILAGEKYSEQECDDFDEWKLNHSSDDVLFILSEIGKEKL